MAEAPRRLRLSAFQSARLWRFIPWLFGGNPPPKLKPPGSEKQGLNVWSTLLPHFPSPLPLFRSTLLQTFSYLRPLRDPPSKRPVKHGTNESEKGSAHCFLSSFAPRLGLSETPAPPLASARLGAKPPTHPPTRVAERRKRSVASAPGARPARRPAQSTAGHPKQIWRKDGWGSMGNGAPWEMGGNTL